jgi:hypothetical protein
MDLIRIVRLFPCPPGYAKSTICKHSHDYANKNRVRKRKQKSNAMNAENETIIYEKKI